MTERFGEKVVVFAGERAQAEMIGDLLGAAGVEASLGDAGFAGMFPSAFSGAVKVAVALKDVPRAREILENAAAFRSENTDPGDPEAPSELASPETDWEADEGPRPPRPMEVVFRITLWVLFPLLVAMFVSIWGGLRWRPGP